MTMEPTWEVELTENIEQLAALSESYPLVKQALEALYIERRDQAIKAMSGGKSPSYDVETVAEWHALTEVKAKFRSYFILPSPLAGSPRSPGPSSAQRMIANRPPARAKVGSQAKPKEVENNEDEDDETYVPRTHRPRRDDRSAELAEMTVKATPENARTLVQDWLSDDEESEANLKVLRSEAADSIRSHAVTIGIQILASGMSEGSRKSLDEMQTEMRRIGRGLVQEAIERSWDVRPTSTQQTGRPGPGGPGGRGPNVIGRMRPLPGASSNP
jgi:hypothetical protein